ncbi:MAG: hypothetical protein ABIW76_23690 [Fibrobacteria bacterium]
MPDKNSKDKKPETADGPSASPSTEGVPEKKAKKEKVSIDPAQRKKGGFDRSILKGKAPIFRTMKKSGR